MPFSCERQSDPPLNIVKSQFYPIHIRYSVSSHPFRFTSYSPWYLSLMATIHLTISSYNPNHFNSVTVSSAFLNSIRVPTWKLVHSSSSICAANIYLYSNINSQQIFHIRKLNSTNTLPILCCPSKTRLSYHTKFKLDIICLSCFNQMLSLFFSPKTYRLLICIYFRVLFNIEIVLIFCSRIN